MRNLLISEQAYDRDLSDAVDVIFEMATYIKEWDWQTLAKMAKLSYNTVYRLGSRITNLPRWMTFWKLARAVGLRVSFVDAKGREVTLAAIRQTHGVSKPKRRLKRAVAAAA